MKKKLAVQPIRKTRLILAFFILTLLSPLYCSDIQCEWTGVQKIVAVGDLHGDYDSFVDILKGTGLVDKKIRWTGGKSHLVQIGDVMDRGDYAKEIFDLLMRLEKEAEKAGGKVHLLLGNHEEMNIIDIAFDYENYITLKQFKDFLPDKYKESKEKGIIEYYKKQASEGHRPGYTLDEILSNYWDTIRRRAMADKEDEARIKYWTNFNEKFGKWLVEHNVVIKINDIIFVHGGISEKFSTWKLGDINDRMRLELDSFIKKNPISSEDLQVVYQSEGPLWYRVLAMNEIKDEDLKPVVDEIFKNLGIKHMVLAHSWRIVKSKKDMERLEGRIWVIDTGISSKIYRGGRETALIIEDTGNDYKFSVWPLDFNEESKQPIEQTRNLQEWMATKAFELPEFIACILRDALRMRIFIGGNNEN